MGFVEAIMWIVIVGILSTTTLIFARIFGEYHRFIEHDRQETLRQREYTRQLWLDSLSGNRPAIQERHETNL